MMAERARVFVTYCEGWDPESKSVVGVIPAALAQERDVAGEPYAVLLHAAVKPFAFLQIHRNAGYLGLYHFDEHGRRVTAFDYRQLDPDALHLRKFTMWLHPTAEEPEFGSAATFTVTIEPDGRARQVLDLNGSFHTTGTIPVEHYRMPSVRFGHWPFDADGLTPRTEFDFVDTEDPEESADTGHTGPTWSAPTGLRPGHLDALFAPGAVLKRRHDGRIAQIAKPEQAGLVKLPTGRVIAADPGWLDAERIQPYTATVPPGVYPMIVATMTWQSESWGDVPAVKLQISEHETTTWELALTPGQDPRLLGAGEFYGFGVDTGTGAFLDASGREALARAVEDHWSQQDGGSDADYPEISDETTGTNLFMYPSGMGDGSYPVWIGRNAAGEVTCFIADMTILHDAELLSGPPPETTRFIDAVPQIPPPDQPADRAPVFQPAATGHFMVSLCTQTAQTRQQVSSRFQRPDQAN